MDQKLEVSEISFVWRRVWSLLHQGVKSTCHKDITANKDMFW